MKILFLGDVMGRSGRAGVAERLPRLRDTAVRMARPVFFSVLVILLVYVPVLALSGADKPFAGTIDSQRIGLMGYGSRANNVFVLLSALEQLLAEQNLKFEHGASIAAATGVYEAGK